MLSPRCSRATSDGRLRRFVVLVKAGGRRRDGVARQQMGRPPRVFGGDQRDFAQDPQRPAVMSSRLPIGVATTNSVPGMKWTAFIVPLTDRVGGPARPATDRTHCAGAMPASEPLPHFVDDLLGYLHETHPTHATLDGVHTHDDLLEDLSRQGIDSEAHALSGYLRRLDEIDRDGADRDRAARAPDARLAPARRGCSSSRRCAPGSATRSSTPTSSRPAWPGRRCSRTPGARARAPRAVEAAPDAAADPGGARQHQGAARHLRQGRHRDDARRAEVHRRRSAARLRERRRPAPARRSRRRADRSVAGGRRLHRVPRDRGRAEGARVVPARPRQVRAEGAARRGHRDAGRSAAGDRDARAERDAGGVQAARRHAERRRSARGLGEDQGGTSRRRASSCASAASSSTSWRPSSSARRSSPFPQGEAGHRRADARVLPLVVRQHVDAGAVREQADARLLLPDRRRSVLAGRAAGRVPARLQLPDALVDLDPRGLPGPLPALPAPAAGRRRRRASRSCSRRRRSSKAGRTTASR